MGYFKEGKVLHGFILISVVFFIVTVVSDQSPEEGSTDDDIDCGPLPNITNGVVELSDEGNTSYGAQANVICYQGYEAHTSVLTCLDTGDWEDWESFASCDRKDCGEVPNIDNGIFVLRDVTNTTYGATANVTCDEGYVANATNISCLDTGQWQNNVTCSGCGPVPDLDDGEIVLVDSANISYGAKANVTCEPGYESNVKNITCLSSGVWEDNVTCESVGCNPFAYFLHGHINLIGNDSRFGAIAVITCDTGYNTSSLNVTCLESGEWENVTCNITGCEQEVPTIEHGELIPVASSNVSLANVTCDSGYVASTSTISCLDTGVWEEANCTLVECNASLSIPHGRIDLTGDGRTYGAIAYIECESGYTPSVSEITCLASGEWENATCDITGCGSLPDIPNGFISDENGISVGSVADVSCDEGYTTNVTYIECLTNGVWETSSCYPIECNGSLSIPHGRIDLTGDGRTYGATAYIECESGYTPSVSEITCLASGEWENATCDITGCATFPPIPNGFISYESGITVGSVADISCNEGFYTNVTYIICLANGKWENSSCSPRDCGDVERNLANGVVELMIPNNTTYGAKATVRCDEGFEAVPLTVSCTATGEWQGASCEPIDCGDPPDIQYGTVTLVDTNTDYGAEALLGCESGFDATLNPFICEENGYWENTTCSPKDCGDVPDIDNGNIVLADSNNSTFRARATVNCDSGYSPDKSHITCLSSGIWDDNVTCIMNDCDVDDVPDIANGEVIPNVVSGQTTATTGNVSCNSGFAATSPEIACLNLGVWQDDVLCVSYGLGVVRVETGHEIANGEHTAYFKCVFTIADGLKYRIKWYIDGVEFYDTGILSSTQASASVIADDLFTDEVINNFGSQFFGLQIMCSATVFDGAGTTELENETSAVLEPLKVSTNSITMVRGTEVTFTVFLDASFGCASDSGDCFLRYIVYDIDDTYRCYDCSVAAVHSDTCGGKVEGATPGTTGHVTTVGTFTNITITTKYNRWYRLRSSFELVLQLSAVGNSKAIWNTPSTSIAVQVTENYLTRYRGCYSFVDPYMLTFDWRWYAMMLLEEFILFRHKTQPIEVQIVTAPCNRWATCVCAVTVRAGGDVFTINNCYGHLTAYLSRKDGILKVYRLWSTYYQIILPNGMYVYAYVMSYMDYMMNVYITPALSDFEQSEGLCGNFNGNFRDDTVLRGSSYLDPVESVNGNWYWLSDYWYPHTFAFSWGLRLTGRSDESLLNPEVYRNVELWDSNRRLCICPYAESRNNYDSWCSPDEEATCTGYIWRWGTLVEGNTQLSERELANKLGRMMSKWEAEYLIQAPLRKKRQATNTTTAMSREDAETLCLDIMNDCPAFANKDDLSDVADWNDTLENCMRDTAESGDTTWIQAHCDSFAQKVTDAIEKDVDYAENNTDLVTFIQESSCPGNCSGHGQCVNRTCVCVEDFATDLCLINITLGPLLEELADDGICDISNGSLCNYILVVGNGFVETATCNLTVYVAGIDGIFNFTEEYEINCTYLNFNELLAPVLQSNSSGNATNATEIARMIEISVSNDGSHFGVGQTVVILDTTCQQTQVNANGETTVTLKTGYCYIEATCYTSDEYMTGSSCAKCDTSQDLFFWTDVCNNAEDEKRSNLVIILGSVGGAVLVVAVSLGLVIYFYLKAKAARALAPLVETSLGPSKSKMKFWLREGSDVAVVHHHLGDSKKGRPLEAEYLPEND